MPIGAQIIHTSRTIDACFETNEVDSTYWNHDDSSCIEAYLRYVTYKEYIYGKHQEDCFIDIS